MIPQHVIFSLINMLKMDAMRDTLWRILYIY